MILRPWVVLLAAGGSRRFGRPKLLERLRGETLIHRAARVALSCRAAGCTIVLGAHASRLAPKVAGLPLAVIVNRGWRTGLAGSLRAGIASIPPTAPAALVLLADQVAIGPADLELLIAAWRTAPRSIVAARSGAALGPPAILPRGVFRDVRPLRGDTGAKSLLADPSRRVIEIAIEAAAIDVDQPEDLDRQPAGAVIS